MAVDYNKKRAMAQRIINRYGGPGQIILKGVTGGTSVGGDTIPDTPDTLIDGIITPLIQYKTHEIDGTSILNGDSWVLWQTTSSTEIEIDMQITLNSKTFMVKSVQPFSSIDDINVFIKIQLRIG